MKTRWYLDSPHCLSDLSVLRSTEGPVGLVLIDRGIICAMRLSSQAHFRLFLSLPVDYLPVVVLLKNQPVVDDQAYHSRSDAAALWSALEVSADPRGQLPAFGVSAWWRSFWWPVIEQWSGRMSRSAFVGHYLSENPDAVLDDLNGRLHLVGPSRQMPRERLRVGTRVFDLPVKHRGVMLRMVGRRVHAVVTRVGPRRSVLLSIHPTDVVPSDSSDLEDPAEPVEPSAFGLAYGVVYDAVCCFDPTRTFWPPSALSADPDLVAVFSGPAVALRELWRRGLAPVSEVGTFLRMLNEVRLRADEEADFLRDLEARVRRPDLIYVMENTFKLSDLYRAVSAEYRKTVDWLLPGGPAW